MDQDKIAHDIAVGIANMPLAITPDQRNYLADQIASRLLVGVAFKTSAAADNAFAAIATALREARNQALEEARMLVCDYGYRASKSFNAHMLSPVVAACTSLGNSINNLKHKDGQHD